MWSTSTYMMLIIPPPRRMEGVVDVVCVGVRFKNRVWCTLRGARSNTGFLTTRWRCRLVSLPLLVRDAPRQGVLGTIENNLSLTAKLSSSMETGD